MSLYLNEVIEYVKFHEDEYDAIVVEGYDGVGKGRILNTLSESLGVVPYRPNYNLWQQYDLNPTDRWKISGYFLDIYSHFQLSNKPPLLFDRGVLSGAVYNHDFSIAANYRYIIRDMRVLHIIVTCSHEDYIKFYKLRNPKSDPLEINVEWSKYLSYTADYIECLEEYAKLPYILCINTYDKELAERVANTCEGCGHYSYGMCKHPSFLHTVDKSDTRCHYSSDKEVQDQYASEVHSV